MDERFTQRGPWASLSQSQKRYYTGVQKKADRARKAAIRAIYADTSPFAQALARDIAFLDTFDFDVPMSKRQPYVDASMRVRVNIRNVCGIESSL